MRLQRRTPQRLTIFFLVGAIVYFWGAWTLHNLFTLKQGDPSVRVSPPIELAVPLTSDPIVVPKATTAPVIRNKSAKAPPRPDGTFAACLLVMDDNHFLTEWLVSSSPFAVLKALYALQTTLTLPYILCKPFTGVSLPHITSSASHYRRRPS
jgi:hypothetical protein